MYNPLVNALNPSTNSLRVEGSFESEKQRIVDSLDLETDITYSDIGTNDQRIDTMTYSSVTLGKSYTETFNYSGSAGNYILTSITTA